MRPADDQGSAPAEFVMVVSLLLVLTFGVLQLALSLVVRNTVLDAAAEGARVAALADNTLDDGTVRTRQLISTAVGAAYARHVEAGYGDYLGEPAVIVTVRAPLPIAGLFGIEGGMEVHGHAPVETLDGLVAR
jgi:hypothetical protein